MRILRKNAFLAINYIYIVGLLLSITNMRFGTIAGKFKFIFIIFCIYDLYSLHKKINTKVIVLFCVLFGYVVLWSTVFVNPIVAGETKKHFIMSMIYLIILFLSCCEIDCYNCEHEYILCSYYACITVLLMQCISHSNELIKNPFYIFQAVFTNLRVRSSFGFMHTNYAGNVSFVALALSWILYQDYTFSEVWKSKRCMRWLIMDGFALLILISTSCRSAIIALFIFIAGTVLFKFDKKFHLSFKLKCCIVAFALVIFVLLNKQFGLLNFVWSNSNRQSNVDQNIVLIEKIGNIWTGMGFVENGAFQASWSISKGMVSAFGAGTTTSLDMNYVYILCTTGILGSCIMGMILLWLLCELIRKRKMKYVDLCLYISVLFYAIWETVIFTYRFWTMLIIMAVIICNAFGKGELENDNIY